jgi:chromosome segregation ATPase
MQEAPAMTALLAPGDALAESQRLIAALERRRSELPFADDVLAIHRPTHQNLERSSSSSDDAVEAWRAALARRWECEVAGRRLYKQIFRQLAEHLGRDDAPEIQLLSRGEAEVNSSPAELLHDLHRLQAALELVRASLPFAAQRLAEVERICAALESAIAEANSSEEQRRASALERRMAQEAYRRARATTQRALIEHYGSNMTNEFAELFI